MPSAPSATTSVSESAGAYAGGTGYACIIAPVGTNADASAPRVYTNLSALMSQHSYAPGVDLAAMMFEECRSSPYFSGVLFVGVPIVTAGVLGSQRTNSTWTGTAQVSVAAGSAGYLEEVDAILTVTTAGTVGTGPGPVFTLSLDGGRTSKTVRLGTATSYTVPHVGIVISFTSGGTLVAADTYSFRTTQPKMDNTGLTAARTAIAAQQKAIRTMVIVGDLADSTAANNVVTQINAFLTTNKRASLAVCQVADGGTCAPQARMAGVRKFANFAAAVTLTFAEVGATGDTITRSAGSWITDGFAVGDVVTVAGSVSNNVTGRIAALTATVLTFDTTDLANEGPTVALGTITVAGSNGIIFAEVGATGDTITRNAGSWISDGFAVGDTVTIASTASNNGTTDAITALSATVMTLGSFDLTAEEIGSHAITIVKSQTTAAHVAAMDTAFTSIDAQRRIELCYGRARKTSPVLDAYMRRPTAWAKTLREYQHDLHVAPYRVADGPLSGWSLENANGQIVEYDERVTGGALAGRFTCLTTQDNGPNGAFVALSLTRETEGKLLTRTQNLMVANMACQIVQAETVLTLGESLILNTDGTPSEESCKRIESRVNKALQIGLLQGGRDGQRASACVFSMSRSDILSTVGATSNTNTDLYIRGTLEQIANTVTVK